MTKAKIALVVFLLSIAITSIFWAVLPPSWRSNESSDYLIFYEPVAQRLLAGQGITLPGGELAIRYPPGYPLVLASVFALAQPLSLPDDSALAGFILLCTGLSSALLFLLASEVFDLRIGVASALLWMTYPFNLWLTKQPNSEIPFIVLLFASVLVFWRFLTAQSVHGIGLILAGLLAGSAALIRPIAIGLAGVFAGFLLLQNHWSVRSRLIGTGAILLGFLAVILPWEIGVYRHTQQVIPLSTGGALSAWDGLTYAVEGDYQAGGRIPAKVNDLMVDLLSQSHASTGGNLGSLMAILGREAAHNPSGALQLLGLKAARSWYGTESGRLEFANAMIQCVYLIAIAWGGLTVWRSGGIKRRYFVFIAVLALYAWLMTIAALSILRYMVPVIGLLITLIPAGIFRFPGVQTTLDRWMPLR